MQRRKGEGRGFSSSIIDLKGTTNLIIATFAIKPSILSPFLMYEPIDPCNKP